MTISGVKVIRLSDEEKGLLSDAGRLLSDLADEIEMVGVGYDGAFVMELNRAYETCLDVVRENEFKYALDDGDE